MILVPFTTFFYLRWRLYDEWITGVEEPKKLRGLEVDVDTWAALGAIAAVQVVIGGIVLVKYGGDLLDVFVRDRGYFEYTEEGDTRGSKRPVKTLYERKVEGNIRQSELKEGRALPEVAKLKEQEEEAKVKTPK
jgi:hypothetical protein